MFLESSRGLGPGPEIREAAAHETSRGSRSEEMGKGLRSCDIGALVAGVGRGTASGGRRLRTDDARQGAVSHTLKTGVSRRLLFSCLSKAVQADAQK